MSRQFGPAARTTLDIAACVLSGHGQKGIRRPMLLAHLLLVCYIAFPGAIAAWSPQKPVEHGGAWIRKTD